MVGFVDSDKQWMWKWNTANAVLVAVLTEMWTDSGPRVRECAHLESMTIDEVAGASRALMSRQQALFACSTVVIPRHITNNLVYRCVIARSLHGVSECIVPDTRSWYSRTRR